MRRQRSTYRPATLAALLSVWALWSAGAGSAPLPAAVPEPLGIRVAYSPKLRAVPGWSADLDRAVAQAGAILDEALGRRLVVESRVPWFGAAVGRSPRELRQALVEDVEREGADLVLGLAVHARPPRSAQRPPGVLGYPDLDFTEDEGLTHYTEGYLVLDVRGEEIRQLYRLLAHEIAHVFGGVHRRERRSLMNPRGDGVVIDPLNAELLALHRDRRFGRGRAPLSGEDLRRLWRLARAELDEPRTWLVVGVLAVRMGKAEAAVPYYEKALALDPDHRPALVNLGHVHFQLGELRSAEARYLEALALAEADGLVWNNLAAVYYGRGEPEKSFAYLEKALAHGFAVDPRFVAEIEKATGRRLSGGDP